MRILDQSGNELQQADVDFSKGRLEPDKLFVRHHDEIPAVEEQKHEVVTEYPETGGKDIRWVIDVPAKEAVSEWDEYEDILRYIPYTDEELAEQKETEERQARLDALIGDGLTWDDLAAALAEGVNSI